ncbi:MAG: hypothetical protein LKJ88_00535 [Bacilli bacterium]|jgi:hypothetical protein|nr:hypothetical protein [Bacilli bacterium]
MKRVLLIAGAAVLLASGIGASVFAKYNASTDGKSGDINAKQFVMVEADDSTAAKYATVSLAPGEEQSYSYSVVNYDAANISEVDINVTFAVALSGDLANALTIDNANYTCVLAKDVKSTGTFSFKVSFPDAADNNNYIGKTATLAISCSGVQA